MIGMDRLPPLPQITPLPSAPAPQKLPARAGDFAATLKEFVSDVNEMQQTANQKALQFATGQIQDLHEVMAAAEEAGISLMLLLELRNKALEAYKELMRLPV